MAISERQLDAIGRVDRLFGRMGIDYWLFGGWAVDFHAGRTSRTHDDIDVAIWRTASARADAALAEDGWSRCDADATQGIAAYERDLVRLEVALLAADADRAGDWPVGSFADDRLTLGGVQARVVSLQSLVADKSMVRDDATVAAKDRADVATLTALAER